MLTQLPAWQALEKHYQDIAPLHLRDLFAQDDSHTISRAQKFTRQAVGLTLDFSKNRINDDTLKLLQQLAKECKLDHRIEAMRGSETINTTENRAVLHIALRNMENHPILFEGEDVMPKVQAVWRQMERFCHSVRSGVWRGYSGSPITDIINIGIGGSDLGPRMASEALEHLAPSPHDIPHQKIRTHFVANIDGAELSQVLAQIDVASTLVIICSKTFTTQETIINANSAKAWFIQQGVPEKDLHKHFVAVSTNAQKVSEFGIDPSNMFEFWDWVGGRFSVWSAIGLALALQIGFGQFRRFLAGANAMDQHFFNAPFDKNLPVLLALIGIWNRNFLDTDSLCIAPYAQVLERFPTWLAQTDMESNGKGTKLDGSPVVVGTAPVVWGEAGSNGQHAFFQMLHQGTQCVPVDFIAVLEASHPIAGHHSKMLANCFAQSEALMKGRTLDEIETDDPSAIKQHKIFGGNRVSNTIVIPRIDAFHLGALMAMYEHKIFVQSVIWQINAFDQWGVELGKLLAKPIESDILGQTDTMHDSSTQALIALAKTAQPN